MCLFSYHLDLVQKIKENLNFVWKIQAVGDMIILYQNQHHLPTVMSHS